MKIAVIGASVGVGIATVNRALELGHNVSAISRRKIEVNNPNFTHIQGSALNQADLEKTIDGADVILVTLGTVKVEATTLYSDFARLIVKMNVQVPVIVVTGFGAGDSGRYVKLMLKPVFRFILNKVYADKTVMEQILTSSKLRWEIVRPGVLNHKPLTEKYRIETELRHKINIGAISRNDVADFLVKEAVNQKYIGKYVSLSNK